VFQTGRQISYLALIATLGFLWDTQAAAQEAGTAASEVTAGTDIIVTARRVEERLQDVPISITAFDQQQLDQRNIFAAKDLAAFTPSLSVNTRYGADYGSFSIRGFAQEERTTASVGVYFADVVAPRNGATTQSGDGLGPGSYFDLQSVQVLKGPQGTLFGRNTTGGAILLVPRKPVDGFEGYVEAGVGNYDMRRVQAVVNTSLSDTFLVRAGMDWQKRDGYLVNTTGVGPRTFADIDYVAARLSILAKLTPDLENYTIVSYSNSKPNGTLPKLTDCFDGLARIFTAQFVCPQLQRERSQPFRTVSNYLPDARQQVKQWQVINTTTWQASDTLTIKNIASYAEQVQDQAVDLIGLGFVIPDTVRSTSGATIDMASLYPQYVGLLTGSLTVQSPPGLASSDQSTFTEELQLQGRSANGRLTWQGGGYYEYSAPLGVYGIMGQGSVFCSDFATYQCQDIFGIIDGTAIGSVNRRLSKTTYRSIGLYAQGSYEITHSLNLTAGLRYTWDRTRAEVVDKANYVFDGPDRNQPVRSCIDDPAKTDCRKTLSQNSKAPTWLLGLDFKPKPGVLLYAKWARGYRQGSASALNVEGRETYEPEKVDTYEIGAKTSFDGFVRGTFNIAAFYNDFRDQQLKVTFSGIPPYGSNLAIINAGKSRIYGVEVDTSIMPFEGFRLEASYAYLNSKLTDLDEALLISPDPTKYAAGRGPVEGGPLPFTPKHKLVLSADYTLPLPPEAGAVIVGGTYTYTSRMFYQVGGTSTGQQTILGPRFADFAHLTSNELVNLHLDWTGIAGSKFDAQVFVNNLFNRLYFNAHNISPAQGFVLRYVGEPRMYGMKLRYNF
jgi:iron complex outermembrane receptor protein